MTNKDETVTFRITSQEKEDFLTYCNLTSRTQTDVFREFIRSIQKKLLKKGTRCSLL